MSGTRSVSTDLEIGPRQDARRAPSRRRRRSCLARRVHRSDLRPAPGVADAVRPGLRLARGAPLALCRGAGGAADAIEPACAADRGADGPWVLGTLLSAAGYALAGASAGLPVLCIALVLAGARQQHAASARLFGHLARLRDCGARAARHLQFRRRRREGDDPAVDRASLLTVSGVRIALWLVAGAGALAALCVAQLLPHDRVLGSRRGSPSHASSAGARDTRPGFGMLVAIGMLDNAARPAFLIYLPFLLKDKGRGADDDRHRALARLRRRRARQGCLRPLSAHGSAARPRSSPRRSGRRWRSSP